MRGRTPTKTNPRWRNILRLALVATTTACITVLSACGSSKVAWEDISGTWVGDDGAIIVIHADGTCDAANVNVYRITMDEFAKSSFAPDVTKEHPLCGLNRELPRESFRDFTLDIDRYAIDVKVKGRGDDQRLEVYRFRSDPDDLTDAYTFFRR